MPLEKAGSGSVEPEDFNRVVDALDSGPSGPVTAGDVDSQAAQDGDVLTADGAGGASWEAGGGSAGAVKSAEFLFTEVAGFGTYTATLPITAGTLVLDVIIYALSVWSTDDFLNAANLTIGDTGNSDGYFADFSMSATPLDAPYTRGSSDGWRSLNGSSGSDYQSSSWNAPGPGLFYETSDTITLTVAVIGDEPPASPTGVALIKIVYVDPITADDAVFAPV